MAQTTQAAAIAEADAYDGAGFVPGWQRTLARRARAAGQISEEMYDALTAEINRRERMEKEQ